jgi:arginyl-tRNA--protein-N-Asp/Glu arginylyltransferase
MISHECGDRSSRVVSPLYGNIPLDFVIQGDMHACPYLPLRKAREEIFTATDFLPELYHDFMDHGFRRSGHYFYRPVCPHCQECRPLRVVVAGYKSSKSHRRIVNKNRDIDIHVDVPRISREKQRLYSRYLAVRHDGYQSDTLEDLRSFLYSSPVHTLEFVYRLRGKIVAVGIVDMCSRSLSTVYAYYDPDEPNRCLGTFSALQEIGFCRANAIPYYYMGYYVAGCPSMKYKARFKPHEILDPLWRWRSVASQ